MLERLDAEHVPVDLEAPVEERLGLGVVEVPGRDPRQQAALAAGEHEQEGDEPDERADPVGPPCRPLAVVPDRGLRRHSPGTVLCRRRRATTPACTPMAARMSSGTSAAMRNRGFP